MSDDFLIRVQVDERGVESYLREMGNLPAKLKRIEADFRNIPNLGGLRPTGSGDPLSRAVRNQVQATKRGQNSLRRSMAGIAIETQKDVVRRQEQLIKHRTASSGALAKFTASQYNRKIVGGTFGIGDIQRMTRSRVVAYALAIEGGSRASLGRVITGYWEGGSGIHGFSRSRTGDRFVRASASAASRALKEAGNGRGAISGVVRRPIVAQNAYRKTARYFKPQAKTAAALRKAYGFA